MKKQKRKKKFKTGPSWLEIAAIEIADEIVKAVPCSIKGNWDFKTIKSLISEIKTPELQILAWQEVCFLLAYFF